MSLSEREFRRVMGAFATGVTVVTTRDREGEAYGLTVNSFTSVSMNPRLILVCLDNQLSGLEAFLEGEKFGVNILAQEQQDVSAHFASKGSDRSAWIEATGKTGVPLLGHALACLECRLVRTVEAGDHTILIGEVVEASGPRDRSQPLVFYRGRYRALVGAEPRRVKS